MVEEYMHTAAKSPSEIFKELEDDLNCQLYSLTNSKPFISMAGKALDQHLDMLIELRMVTRQWLELMCLPTRDDVVDIAQRLIKTEDRLDSLDENLYQILDNIKDYRNEIGRLKDEIAEFDRPF
jgi:chromosome segregation ATPase